MTRCEYLNLMRFPKEWEAWGLIDEVWLAGALKQYEPGNETASEHDRHGAFQWWLKRQPTKDILLKLAKLSWLDPDEPMGSSVRKSIAESKACDAEVLNALTRKT